MNDKIPIYARVHSEIRRLGSATAPSLRTSLGLEPTQVMAALFRLKRIGAASTVSRGVWVALDMPERVERRGRPRGTRTSLVRGQVLAALADGPLSLSRLVQAIVASSGGEPAGVRNRVANALVLLAREGAVSHTGTRGTYAYGLVASQEGAAARRETTGDASSPSGNPRAA